MNAVSTSNFKAPDIFKLNVNLKDKPELKTEKINKHSLKSNTIHQEFMNKRKSSIIATLSNPNNSMLGGYLHAASSINQIEEISDIETFQLEEDNVLVNVSVKMSNIIEHKWSNTKHSY
jgi:hypothetical protein